MEIYGTGGKRMVRVLTEENQFNEIRNQILQSRLFSVDTETTWTNLFHQRMLLGLTVTTDKDTLFTPVGHQAYIGSDQKNYVVPLDLFSGVTIPILAYNMKLDYQVLQKVNVNLPTDNLWCTMMMAVYIDENNKGKDARH